MRNIYIVAHPEATHHTKGLVGGWYDSELTERGRKHADNIGEELAATLDGTTAEVISSDLLRARQTAEVVASALTTNVMLDPDLREKSFGEAEGKPQAWLRERRIPLPDEGERLNHDEGIAGAESRWQLARRCYRAMARIMKTSADDQIVVTHGGPTTLLIAAWIGMPIEAAGQVHFRTTSGSITVLRKDPHNFSHQVTRLNDVSHLAHDLEISERP